MCVLKNGQSVGHDDMGKEGFFECFDSACHAFELRLDAQEQCAPFLTCGLTFLFTLARRHGKVKPQPTILRFNRVAPYRCSVRSISLRD